MKKIAIFYTHPGRESRGEKEEKKEEKEKRDRSEGPSLNMPTVIVCKYHLMFYKIGKHSDDYSRTYRYHQ